MPPRACASPDRSVWFHFWQRDQVQQDKDVRIGCHFTLCRVDGHVLVCKSLPYQRFLTVWCQGKEDCGPA